MTITPFEVASEYAAEGTVDLLSSIVIFVVLIVFFMLFAEVRTIRKELQHARREREANGGKPLAT